MSIEEKIFEFDHRYDRFTLFKRNDNVMLNYFSVFDRDTWETDEFQFIVKKDDFNDGIDNLISKGRCNIPITEDYLRIGHSFYAKQISFEEKNGTIHFGFDNPYVDMRIKTDELKRFAEDYKI